MLKVVLYLFSIGNSQDDINLELCLDWRKKENRVSREVRRILPTRRNTI
jgi:hypothetical protein